jgi:hypothetical protein
MKLLRHFLKEKKWKEDCVKCFGVVAVNDGSVITDVSMPQKQALYLSVDSIHQYCDDINTKCYVKDVGKIRPADRQQSAVTTHPARSNVHILLIMWHVC